jgi:hypothetical protein
MLHEDSSGLSNSSLKRNAAVVSTMDHQPDSKLSPCL